MASSILESLTKLKVQGVTLFYSFSGMDVDRQTGDKLVRTLYQLLQIVADNVSFQHARDLIINGLLRRLLRPPWVLSVSVITFFFREDLEQYIFE